MDVRHTHQGIDFEWASEKASANLAKHGVSFKEACEAFFDPFLIVDDEEVVGEEARDSIVGMTTQWQVLCVIHTIRFGDRFRIISAREATPAERQRYESQ